jgi:hypothetical protein
LAGFPEGFRGSGIYVWNVEKAAFAIANGGDEWWRCHHHAGATAVGCIVHFVMGWRCKLSRIYEFNANSAAAHGFTDDATTTKVVKKLREESNEAKMHGIVNYLVSVHLSDAISSSKDISAPSTTTSPFRTYIQYTSVLEMAPKKDKRARSCTTLTHALLLTP